MNHRGRNPCFLLVFVVLLSGACQQQTTPTPTPVAAAISSPLSATLLPTLTVAAALPAASPSTQTSPTSPLPETATLTVTASDMLPDFLVELQAGEYILQENSAPLVLDETVYTGYLLNLPTMNPLSEAYTGETGQEVCRLIISQTEGEKEVVAAAFDAPPYPTGSYLFPQLCFLINWDMHTYEDIPFGDSEPIAAASRELLNLNAYQSDINQNGWPELAVAYFACRVGCRDASITTHFYEIQGESSIVDVTVDLPGMLLPWKLSHGQNPLELFVYDPQGEYESHEYFDMWWIFAWDGVTFVDVTNLYPDEVRTWGTEKSHTIQEVYGQGFFYGQPTQLLSLLLQYDRVGLRDEGVTLFLTLTDPVHWPETDHGMMCWLQTIRYYVQLDKEQGHPFRLPPGPHSEQYWADPCSIPERSN